MTSIDQTPGIDSPSARKRRGAFFTPPAIANHLVTWALDGMESATIFDPTCGDGEFLLASDRVISSTGRDVALFDYWGADLHRGSLNSARERLSATRAGVHLLERDVFTVEPESANGVPKVDIVVGNPPFIRFQEHKGTSRETSRSVARQAGVELSGLASSWAAALVHASRFLKSSGRLAMVLPAELLTVAYAAPIREWLRQRFRNVNIVLFEKLQFESAQADVILLLAEGTGSCDAFSLWPVAGAEDLAKIKPYSQINVNPGADQRWGDLLISSRARSDLAQVGAAGFGRLSELAELRLGSVTGANSFFVLTENKRKLWSLKPGLDVRRISPSIRAIRGTAMSNLDWIKSRDSGDPVWLFLPRGKNPTTAALRYIEHGESLSVHEGYKCRSRTPWWRVPSPPTADLFFSYMSHRFTRFVDNKAGIAQLNSLHGLRFKERDSVNLLRQALPLLAFNSVTQFAAEMSGRWYGGGILKLEPSEASSVLIPKMSSLAEAWEILGSERRHLESQVRAGEYESVRDRIDEVLLGTVLKTDKGTINGIRNALDLQRGRRINKGRQT